MDTTPQPPSDPARDHVATIAQLHHAAEGRAGRHQRLIELLTARLGRPVALYAAALALVLWALTNAIVAGTGGRAPDPPPFHGLQGVVTVAGFILTAMVLITQQRQTRLFERRAQLDLHVNLLAEQKTAKLVALLEELRRDLPSVPNRPDAEANAMAQAADPHAVLEALEQSLEDGPAATPAGDEKA